VENQSILTKALPPMHHKQIELELSWHSIGKFYKVVKITNSSYYVPGEQIPPEIIKLINEGADKNGAFLYPNWTVSAIDYDYFAAIAALVGGVMNLAASKVLP
jgi:hypothetical protein